MLRSRRSWCDTADSLSPRRSAISPTHSSEREIASRILTRVASPRTRKVSARASTAVASKRTYELLFICSIVYPIAGSALRDRRDRPQGPLVIRLVSGVFEHLAVPDRPVLVQDKHRPLRDALQPDHVLVEDAVITDRRLVEIAQQWKVQPLGIPQRLEREEGIYADAVHLRVRLVERRQAVAESAEFLGTHRAECRGEKSQHNRAAALRAQRDRLAILVDQRKVRRFRTNVYRHDTSGPLGLRFLAGAAKTALPYNR